MPQVEYQRRWYQANKARKKAQVDTWRQSNPGRMKFYAIKKNYGLTREQYETMLAFQDGKCAICGRVPEKFEVDHDHATNKVRGLLCPRCNRWLAAVEAPGWLATALRYLKAEEAE